MNNNPYKKFMISYLVEACFNAKIGSPIQYGVMDKIFIFELWNDELTIRLEDKEGYEIENQVLDFHSMTVKDAEQTIEYLLSCAEKSLV